MIMGGVVPVINIEGVAKGKIKLTPGLLADISGVGGKGNEGVAALVRKPKAPSDTSSMPMLCGKDSSTFSFRITQEDS